jgi:hypothetical protein
MSEIERLQSELARVRSELELLTPGEGSVFHVVLPRRPKPQE